MNRSCLKEPNYDAAQPSPKQALRSTSAVADRRNRLLALFELSLVVPQLSHNAHEVNSALTNFSNCARIDRACKHRAAEPGRRLNSKL